MNQKYQDWIDAKLKSGDDPFTKCAEWTVEMNEAFPELIRSRGQVFLSNLWERDHWWLKTGEGEMVIKRELARVTKERDFLRDAAAYFARESSSGTR